MSEPTYGPDLPTQPEAVNAWLNFDFAAQATEMEPSQDHEMAARHAYADATATMSGRLVGAARERVIEANYEAEAGQ